MYQVNIGFKAGFIATKNVFMHMAELGLAELGLADGIWFHHDCGPNGGIWVGGNGFRYDCWPNGGIWLSDFGWRPPMGGIRAGGIWFHINFLGLTGFYFPPPDLFFRHPPFLKSRKIKMHIKATNFGMDVFRRPRWTRKLPLQFGSIPINMIMQILFNYLVIN